LRPAGVRETGVRERVSGFSAHSALRPANFTTMSAPGPQDIARNADVAALCETGWATSEVVAKIAVVRKKATSVVYGPLRDMPVEPSVILLRLNGKQQMLVH